MMAQTRLYDVKTEAVIQDSNAAELFAQAVEAMRRYSGQREQGIDDEML